MLYIVNVSKKYKEKGIQDYEVRIGSFDHFNILGKFSLNPESSIQTIIKEGSKSVQNFEPDSLDNRREIYMALFHNEEPEKRINIPCIIISNISSNYSQGGLQNYQLSIIHIQERKLKEKIVSYFDHLYEDGASICLEKASRTIENNIYLPSYKTILKKNKRSI